MHGDRLGAQAGPYGAAPTHRQWRRLGALTNILSCVFPSAEMPGEALGMHEEQGGGAARSLHCCS